VVFYKIILPLCIPGVLSTGILVSILSWNEYLLFSVLISQNTMKTLTVGLANYISSTDAFIFLIPNGSAFHGAAGHGGPPDGTRLNL
jgi:ABC-type glycerol-3-phosphate transport system permease component